MAAQAHRVSSPDRTATVALWSPRAVGLPEKVRRHATSSELVESLLYPYLQTTWRVTTRTPPLPATVRMAQLAVDALSGQTCAIDAAEVPLDGTELGDVRWIPRRIRADDVDVDRVRRDLRMLVSRRLRMWSHIDLTLVGVTEAWKRIDLHEVVFSGGTRRLIAVDTLTGDYTSADA